MRVLMDHALPHFVERKWWYIVLFSLGKRYRLFGLTMYENKYVWRGLDLFHGGCLTRMPCIRDMALRGLRARSVRIVLNAWIPPAPSREAMKLISDTCVMWTMFLGWVLCSVRRVVPVKAYIPRLSQPTKTK